MLLVKSYINQESYLQNILNIYTLQMILFAGELWVPEFVDDSDGNRLNKYNQDVFSNNYHRIIR